MEKRSSNGQNYAIVCPNLTYLWMTSFANSAIKTSSPNPYHLLFSVTCACVSTAYQMPHRIIEGKAMHF